MEQGLNTLILFLKEANYLYKKRKICEESYLGLINICYAITEENSEEAKEIRKILDIYFYKEKILDDIRDKY